MGLHLRSGSLQLSPYEESGDPSHLTRGPGAFAGPKRIHGTSAEAAKTAPESQNHRNCRESKSRSCFFRSLLEKEVVPAFYNRDKRGIPIAWVAKMRASMLQLTPRFSSNRTVREYVERYYLSACTVYRDRAMNRSELGIELSDWS